MSDQISIEFDNSFAREMDGFFIPVAGEPAPEPNVMMFNKDLAAELNLDSDVFCSSDGAAVLSGSKLPSNSASLAMAYAGHQFGSFSPQLGDGRALLIGELIDNNGNRKDLQLKGSGPTPFSRGGDGKAAIGPVLREYVIGEAMHALGIPTTRALAATSTGEYIFRERPAAGAVLARVAASHIRVGTFQFFAARGQTEKVQQLANYAIKRHYPEIAGSPDQYLELFRKVRDRQAYLLSKWVLVGFVHGVMNTDNMTISGETIDYGPCAFMDHYDPDTVFSSIDEHGRYAYGKQPTIAQWNLARFAECLIELVMPEAREIAVQQLTDEVSAFPAIYQAEWLNGMREKFGFSSAHEGDLKLANELYVTMQGQNVDFTQLFRELANVVQGNDVDAKALFDEPEAGFTDWLHAYRQRLSLEEHDASFRAAKMDAINPIYIPRNHLVEEALSGAESGDMKPFGDLLKIVTKPYSPVQGAEKYSKPAPQDTERYVTFCGT